VTPDSTWKEKSFDFASEAAKQLITLATGIVTLTVAFSGDVLALSKGNLRGWLTASWIAFLLSVVFGVAHLLALTGQLSRAPKEPDVYAPGPRVFSLIQIALFLLGILLAGAYLLLALGQKAIVPPVAPGT
jgi:hypothetical protein